MTASDLPRLKELFEQALAVPAAARDAFLEQACGPDQALRAQVAALVAAHDAAGDFLEDSAAQVPAEQPGSMIGRYKLQEQIGEGGFGVVWMAEQQTPVRRQVALKIIKLGMDTRQVVARFEAERQALAMMDHPNIARVLDGGETPLGRPFFVMELVRGQSITQFCDLRHLDAAARLRLFVNVCHAVQHAHQKGIVHRDLKPSNVMVTLHDGVPVPKVIDFGVAKATRGPLTEKTLFTAFRQMVGTPEYMAPEQAELSGLDVDTRADVYALGVLLYELLTGSSPFAGLRERGVLEMLRVIREEDPPKPSTHVSTAGLAITDLARLRHTTPKLLGRLLRGDLDWIVMKALEKDRARRYETASAFAEDVQRYLRDEPVQAGPPGARYRLRKFVRRHRVGVAAGAAAATALVLGLGASLWGFLEARWQRDAAESARRDALAQFHAANAATAQAEAQRERADRERDRAEAGAVEAKRELTRANTLVRLIEDMFVPADPHSTKGRNYTVRQVLDDFSRDVGAKLASEPEVEAAMHRLIGKVYNCLGVYAQAEPHLLAALDIRRRLFTDRHALVVESRQDMAALRHDQARHADAIHLLHEAKAIAVGLPGDQRVLMAGILHTEADLYRHLGDLTKADASIRAALRIKATLYHQDSRTIAASQASLAGVLQDQGRLPEAEAMFRRSVASLQKQADPDLDVFLGNLAGVLRLERKLDEAEQTLLEVGRMLRERFGEAHPRITKNQADLALVLQDQGRFAEAEALLQSCITLYQEQLGPDHADLAAAYNSLGLVLISTHRPEAAESALRKALGIHEQLGLTGHPNYATTLGNIGRALLGQGKAAAAEAMHRQALDLQRQQLGPVHWAVAARLNCVAEALRAQGKPAESVPLYRESLEIWQQLYGAKHPDIAVTLNDLGSALIDLGQLAEAEPRLRSALEMWQQTLAKYHPHVAVAATNLGVCLEQMGKFDEAEGAYRTALEVLQARGREDDPSIASVSNHLGHVLAAQGKAAEAEAAYLVALQVLRLLGRPERADVLHNLADLAAEQGRHADAIDWLQQALALRRSQLPAGDPALAELLAALGSLQLQADQFAAAELTLREYLGIQAQAAPEEWQRFLVMSLLGWSLHRQGKVEEAEPLLVEGAQKLRAPPAAPQLERDALARVVDHYHERGKAEEEARWRKLLETKGDGKGDK